MLGWLSLPNNLINTTVILRSCYAMGMSFSSSSSGYRRHYFNAKIIKIQNVCVCLVLSRNLFLFFISKYRMKFLPVLFNISYQMYIVQSKDRQTSARWRHCPLAVAASGVAFYYMLSLIDSSNKVSCYTEHVLNTVHVVNAIKIIVIIYYIGGNSIKRGTFWLWCKNESWFSHSLWGPVKTDHGTVGWSSNSLYIWW